LLQGFCGVDAPGYIAVFLLFLGTAN